MSFLQRPSNARDSVSRGKEIFEIKPVLLGGRPTDHANKTLLTRAEHIEAVRYWNNLIRNLRQKSQAERNLSRDT
jgi:hypothetical protein